MNAKYDRIGDNYNSTRKADPYLSQQILTLLTPQVNAKYLDIGCGTGNYTIALQNKGFHFIGMDPSEKMINRAKELYPEGEWFLGKAEETQLESDSVDGILASLTVHHWNELVIAFKELYRVLKTSGRIVIFTSTSEQMEGYWLNHYFPKMLKDSIVQMPDFEILQEAILQAGFQNITAQKYFVQPGLQDHFLYCGKDRPSLYFKQEIRNGISSFSDLANAVEVKTGLAALKKDIEEGTINKIIKEYENDLGDYLFMVATKN